MELGNVVDRFLIRTVLFLTIYVIVMCIVILKQVM